MEEAQAQVEGGSMSAFDEAWDSMKSEEKGKFTHIVATKIGREPDDKAELRF